MCLPESNPFIELGDGDRKLLTDLLICTQMGEMDRENLKDEEEPITGIRDDDIRKDGM
jgi:hypothetical protein